MKGTIRKLFRWIWRAFLAFVILSVVSVILFRWIPVPITPLMLIRCVEQKSNGEKVKLEHEWVSLEELSPHLQLAVVCAEDQNFIKHSGFDLDAIEKAIKHNEKSKRKRGASTISQQTAKNVFLWPGRSWVRKGLEAYFTVLIEIFWSKERIMEVYLNSIEFGDGIYGAQAASQIYFKKDAAKISKEQAALLAIVLPNPIKFNAGKPSSYLRGRQSWCLNQMYLWGGKLDYDADETDEKK